MIAKLSISARITVEALRADRTLRAELAGEISAGLRGEIHPGLRGDLSGLRGDLSGLWGDLSGLRGEIHPGLRGDLSGLRGDLSGLRGEIPADLVGNIDECEISDEERKAGIVVSTLIADGAA